MRNMEVLITTAKIYVDSRYKAFLDKYCAPKITSLVPKTSEILTPSTILPTLKTCETLKTSCKILKSMNLLKKMER